MKNVKKSLIFCLVGIILLQGSLAFADDDFGSFFDSATSVESSSSSPALAFSGETKISARAWLAEDNSLNSNSDFRAMDATSSVKLDFSYEGTASELKGKLLFTTDSTNIIDELTYKAFLGNFVLEAGKSKIVWGRGDKLHVLDLFNANDYSDFLIPDYLDRRIAENMVHLTWNMPNDMSLEVVWTPTMTADTIPASGVWTPYAAKNLTDLGTSYVTNLAKTAYTNAYTTTYATVYAATGDATKATSAAVLAGTSAASVIKETYGSASALLPDTNTLEYSQYGLRLTGTYGPVDWGTEYYLGHYKTPCASYTADSTGITDLDLSYDRLQVFGIDGAGVAGMFNLRGELAYYLTDDTEGTDPSVHNNSIQWLGGFDINLPFNELNLNAQLIGSYILSNDSITSASDVDYNSDKQYLNDKLVLQLSDSYNHEKLKPSIALIWNIEREDLIVMPKVEYQVADGFKVIASGALFTSSDNGEFKAYEHNDFIEFTASYTF
ncbi:hypothetical protein [uncultured Sphaerochaeta sp.]|uniref:hypothetical protein n=1 Tax=uncultured Sphaerochaeta sp. TaxID=886478 RepID=UPI002A0A5AEC|nr:hypothetical protein [uncultured Sphaerochaeta sp.]